MGVLDEIKKLGLNLDETDIEEIEAITDRIQRDKKDDTVKASLIEMHIVEYISSVRPDIMAVLIQEKERENAEWIRKTERKYDEYGRRVCDEPLCPSVKDVAQCRYCKKYVCGEHNYLKGGCACYDCWMKHHEDSNCGKN